MILSKAFKKFSSALVTLAALAAPVAAQTTQAKPAAQMSPAKSVARTTPVAAPPQPHPAKECGCEAGPLPEVLATVGDVRITQADISPEVRKHIADVQQ